MNTVPRAAFFTPGLEENNLSYWPQYGPRPARDVPHHTHGCFCVFCVISHKVEMRNTFDRHQQVLQQHFSTLPCYHLHRLSACHHLHRLLSDTMCDVRFRMSLLIKTCECYRWYTYTYIIHFTMLSHNSHRLQCVVVYIYIHVSNVITYIYLCVYIDLCVSLCSYQRFLCHHLHRRMCVVMHLHGIMCHRLHWLVRVTTYNCRLNYVCHHLHWHI